VKSREEIERSNKFEERKEMFQTPQGARNNRLASPSGGRQFRVRTAEFDVIGKINIEFRVPLQPVRNPISYQNYSTVSGNSY
jgi:hypothetical protein